MRAATSLLATAFCSLAAPGQAWAQDSAAADDAFREGRAHLARGELDQACARFRHSFDLEPATGTLLNLGACEEARGRTATAWATFKRAAERARTERRPSREVEARRRAAALEAVLTRIRIEVPTGAAAITLRLGEVVVGELGVAIAVDPGTHSITARRPGYLPFITEVIAMAPGQTVVVSVPELEPAPVEATRHPRTRAAEPEKTPIFALDDTRRRSRRRVALGLVGVGGLSVAAATASALLARSAWNDAQASGCVDGRCTELAGFESARRAYRLGIATDVLAAVGVAGLVAGTALWVFAPDADRVPSLAISLGPADFGEGFGVTAGGRF